MSWSIPVLVVVAVLVVFTCLQLILWLVLRQQRRQMLMGLHYMLDRLAVSVCDLQRLSEDLLVLREVMERRGLLDAEEFMSLRRELVDIPRQRQAEHAELLEGVIDDDDMGRLVKDFPDTVQ